MFIHSSPARPSSSRWRSPSRAPSSGSSAPRGEPAATPSAARPSAARTPRANACCAWPLLTIALCAAGCATGPFDPVCPPLAAYAPAEQARALRELDALPPDSAVQAMLRDYLLLRDRLRAACGPA